MASQQSTLLQTAHRVLSSYDTWDMEAILAPRTPDCTMRVLPLRLNRPVLSNQEYSHHFTASFKPHFKNFHLEVLDTTEDPARHKVVFHARSTAETPVGPYGNEYMITLQMTDDDLHVKEIKEFVDSQYGAEFMGKLRAHLAGGGSGGSS